MRSSTQYPEFKTPDARPKIRNQRYKTSTAQISAEFLLIVAVAFIVVTASIIISQQQLVDINKSRVESISRNTVNILGSAAIDVYAQGEGARKLVYIEIPNGYEPGVSSIANKTIHMAVDGSDFVYLSDFDVHGMLPANPGNHWVWVISEGNKVRIGSAMMELSKSASNVLLSQNSTKTDDISVTNIYGSQINVTIQKVWPHTDVTLDVSSSSFTLAGGASQPVTLTIMSNSQAAGVYNGQFIFTASSGNTSESITYPVTVEVLVPPSSGTAPPLTITPSIWNQTLLANESSTKAFQVCTNSVTSVSSVDFSVTSGPAGSWIGSLDSLSAMNPDSCQTKVFNISIPVGTYGALYDGTITATGAGASDAQDTVALQITVGGNVTDNIGPLAINVNKIPARPFLGDPVTITATCDDSTRGNSTIKSAEINLDGGGWLVMNPSDGSYNKPAENVSYTFYPIDFGNHNASIRCIDYFDNVGPTVVYKFTVMKEILFITKDEGAGGGEQDWINWLNTHSSNESYVWNMDVVHRNTVVDSGFDINRYAMAIVAEDVVHGSVGSQVTSKLLSYASEGGSVVLVDESVEGAAQPLGLGWGFEYFSQTTVHIIDNTHYITQGFTTGTKTIYTAASKVYYVFPFGGNSLAIAQFWFPSNFGTLGYKNKFIIWGVSKPYRFNQAGNTLTTRIFDYAISNSTVVSQ